MSTFVSQIAQRTGESCRTVKQRGFQVLLADELDDADDKVLFTITGKNVDEYADKLSPGFQALLRTYDSYKIPVYPTRRSASSPQRIYDATRQVAPTARLVENGYGVTGAVVGIPFPVPKSGLEVLWNHLLRYRGEIAMRTIAQAAPTRGGDYTLVQFIDEFNLIYSHEGMTEEALNNKILYFKQEVVAPARLTTRSALR